MSKFILMPWLLRMLVLAFLAMSSSAFAQTKAPEQAKGILWEIKSATNTAYLFGSIHLAKADFYPLPDAVEAAYRQADILAVEADASDVTAVGKAVSLMTYTAPDKLQDHVRPQTWRLITDVVGPAAQQFQPLKPALLATALVVGAFTKQGYEAQYGIDLHFIQAAKAGHKKLVELESLEFQARILGGLSDEDGDAMVAQTLEGLRTGELQRQTLSLIDAWKSGDAIAVAQKMREAAEADAGSKKIMKLLLDDRNVGMAKKITQMMERGDKIFVVVGAGHLVGVNSVVDLLKQQGLQARQIR